MLQFTNMQHQFSCVFADCDMAGHVNNATILTYFETARIQFFQDVIGTDNDWQSTGLILAHSEIDYLEPVYLPEQVKAYSRVTKIGSKSFYYGKSFSKSY